MNYLFADSSELRRSNPRHLVQHKELLQCFIKHVQRLRFTRCYEVVTVHSCQHKPAVPRGEMSVLPTHHCEPDLHHGLLSQTPGTAARLAEFRTVLHLPHDSMLVVLSFPVWFTQMSSSSNAWLNAADTPWRLHNLLLRPLKLNTNLRQHNAGVPAKQSVRDSHAICMDTSLDIIKTEPSMFR